MAPNRRNAPSMLFLSSLLTVIPGLVTATTYQLVKSYSGNTFFNDWDFINDVGHSASGSQTYVDATTALGSLVSVHPDTQHAFLRVDNATNIPPSTSLGRRNSSKIISRESFPMGSVWIVDLFHAPYGCGVQGEIWSLSPSSNWPAGGSIDTFEGLNQEPSSQMSLYTIQGCTASSSSLNQDISSVVNTTNCNDGVIGCATSYTGFPTHGPEFNNEQGGVFITEYASTGISIWFLPRTRVPLTLLNSSSIDTSVFGTPAANWPASICGTNGFSNAFLPQSLVIDIAICADLSKSVYNQSCAPGDCYINNVVGNGSNLAEAYFEIGSILVFQSNMTTGATSTLSISTPTSSSGSSISASAAATSFNGNKSHTGRIVGAVIGSACGLIVCVVAAAFLYRKRKKSAKLSPFFGSDGTNAVASNHPVVVVSSQVKPSTRGEDIEVNSSGMGSSGPPPKYRP